MADRVSISRSTLSRVEQGDPGVGLGTYATVLSELEMGERLANLADIGSDRIGLMLEEGRFPKRVRLSRKSLSDPGLEIGVLDYQALVVSRQTSREKDEAVLKSGAISRKGLQRRNSMIPAGAVARVLSLPAYCSESE